MLFVLVSAGSVDLVLPWKKASSISLLPTAPSGYTVVPALSSRRLMTCQLTISLEGSAGTTVLASVDTGSDCGWIFPVHNDLT